MTFVWAEGSIELPLPGTGFLVPRPEQRAMAACTWVSEKWHHSATAGAVVRCFMRLPGANEDELTAAAQSEMHRLMGVGAEPLRVIVRQTQAALPVMEVGHHARVAALRARAGHLPGVALAGAGLEGSGLPACIRSGYQAAATVAESRSADSGV